MIEVEGLTKSYGEHRGVTDLTFKVEPGEVFGFLGPNGAGKTTAIRLLMGLLRPNAGHARIGSLDCWRDSFPIKRLIGYLPGELELDPNLTGGQILTYFANLRGGVDQTFLRRLIEQLELDPSRKFREYSHGNKRKVGLIQAFMHRPPLLVLDEPTQGLDPLNQAEFDHLVEEVRADGRTVFLSSHILNEVERLCSRVAFIRESQLTRIESVHALMAFRRREMEIVFADPVGVEEFGALPGVEAVRRLGVGRLRLVVQGDVDAVVKRAAQHRVLSLAFKEPNLEAVFLSYYADKTTAAVPEIQGEPLEAFTLQPAKPPGSHSEADY
jgi:ABC-2 type transport system ATP-binding protein